MTGHPHHERVIEELAAAARADGSLGLIVVGSVARGTARTDSDVDVYRVVDDAAFGALLGSDAVSWIEPLPDAWPGAYVDVKVVGRTLLRRAIGESDDPFRASLVGARVVHDPVGDLPELISRITSPPEARFAALARSFADQFGLFAGYFLPHAEHRGDPLPQRHAASRAALAAVRTVLAHDRVLFRGMKYQREQVLASPRGGRAAAEAVEALAEQATVAAAGHVAELLAGVGLTTEVDDPMLGRFIVENELAWFTGAMPPDAR